MDDLDYQYELNLIDNTELSYKSGNSHENVGRKVRFDARGEARQLLLLIFAIIAPWVITAKALGGGQSSEISSYLINIYSNFNKSIAFILCVFGLYWLFYFASNRGASKLLNSNFIQEKLKIIVHSDYKAYVLVAVLFLMGASAIIYTLNEIFTG
jgi:hypothetical protein